MTRITLTLNYYFFSLLVFLRSFPLYPIPPPLYLTVYLMQVLGKLHSHPEL